MFMTLVVVYGCVYVVYYVACVHLYDAGPAMSSSNNWKTTK